MPHRVKGETLRRNALFVMQTAKSADLSGNPRYKNYCFPDPRFANRLIQEQINSLLK